jgi:hypothetical protein
MNDLAVQCAELERENTELRARLAGISNTVEEIISVIYQNNMLHFRDKQALEHMLKGPKNHE